MKWKGRQLVLDIQRQPEADRNAAYGGRSFYFFDFDDNVAFLTTPVFLYHKETGSELAVSSREWAEHNRWVGQAGPYRDFEVRLCDRTGSFRKFRDRDITVLERLLGRRQAFVEDLAQALGLPEYHWQGPSWSCFVHAVFNRRPVSLITARGHHPLTLREGVKLMVRNGHLPHEPNYLSLFPVSHPEVKERLRPGVQATVPELKKAAIRASVEEALRRYGANPHHRFGMSDDDPKNLEMIIDEMSSLKKLHPEMSFFVISTHKGQVVKHEVYRDHTAEQFVCVDPQLPLF